MRTLRPLPRTAILLVGVSISSDSAATLLVAAVLLIAAIVAVVLATRWWARPSLRERAPSASLDEFAVAHWVEDGQRFLSLWQERIAHLGELHERLTAMTQEIGQLRAQVSRIDDLRDENLRLSQEGEALVLERDDLRSVLARIGELIQRASEVRPGAVGGTTPEVGP